MALQTYKVVADAAKIEGWSSLDEAVARLRTEFDTASITADVEMGGVKIEYFETAEEACADRLVAEVLEKLETCNVACGAASIMVLPA